MKKIIAAVGGIILLWIFYSILTLPSVADLKTKNPTATAFMRLYNGRNSLRHYWIPYSRISPHLKNAIVIAEDSNFFFHDGMDWSAVWEAAKKNWEEKEWKWGGSTITQQLAKNLYLNPSKNPLRKFKEMLIAMKIEQTLSKQRILEIYLNVVEWGNGIYGCEAAAFTYFGTSADSLSPYQAAKMAAMLPSPRYFQRKFNSNDLENRTALILRRMGY